MSHECSTSPNARRRIAGIRLEILSHIAAGLGCILWSGLLLLRPSRPRLYERLGWFVLALGLGMLARAVYWVEGTRWLGHVMLGAFGVFPLFLGLFFEALLQRHLHFAAKLALLLGTLFFVGTCWTEVALDSRWWGLALIAYHSLTVAYLGALTLREFLRRGAGPRRSMYGATLMVSVIAVGLMATDWTWLLGMDNPRLGAIPALAVLYFGGSSLDASEEWRVRASLTQLLWYVAAAVLIVGMIGLAVRDLPSQALWVIGGVLLFAAVALEPFRHALVRRRAESGSVLLDRLGHLPARSLEEVLETLRGWPEIEKIVFLRPEEMQLASPPELVKWFEANGSVVTSGEVDRMLALSLSEGQLFVLDQLRHVMTNWRVDYVGLVSPRGELLGVTFTVGLDARTYRRAFDLIILLCRLLPARAQVS